MTMEKVLELWTKPFTFLSDVSDIKGRILFCSQKIGHLE